MTKELEKLKQIIEKFNKKPKQSIRLNPPISIDKVQEIENQYNISFPADYVEFITQLGDGGIIECDRQTSDDSLCIRSLRECIKSNYPFEGLSKTFTLRRSWMPEWGEIIEGDEELDPENEEDWKVLEKHRAERWDIIENCGNFNLITGYFEDEIGDPTYTLIITGTCKGEIWGTSDYGVRRCIKCNFTKWLQLHLTGKLGDFFEKWRQKEYPRNPDPKEQCIAFMKKKKIVMKPPIELNSVREFEQKHNITLPEKYVTFLTEIGDGSIKYPFDTNTINPLWENDCLDGLDKPFLIQNEEDYERVFYDENNEYRSFNKRKPIWDYLFEKSILESCQNKKPWLLPCFQLLNGCLPIMNRNVNSNNSTVAIKQYILILNGDYRGQVWSIGKGNIRKGISAINTFTFLEKIDWGAL